MFSAASRLAASSRNCFLVPAATLSTAGLLHGGGDSSDRRRSGGIVSGSASCDAAAPVKGVAPSSAHSGSGTPLATPPPTAAHENVVGSSKIGDGKTFEPVKAGMVGGGDEQGLFHGLFPRRQLWHPAKPYPLWDANWDGRGADTTGDEEEDRRREREIRRHGVTRHIILIRHGQYDETHKEDEKRILTPLGRKQAEMTGRRLAELVKGADEKFGPCNVRVLRVSDMTRAKETAEIIAAHLPGVEVADPDPSLNEGRPAHNIPGGKARPSVIEKTDECHPRIEGAFERYFYRAPPPPEILREAKDALPSNFDVSCDPSKNPQEAGAEQPAAVGEAAAATDGQKFLAGRGDGSSNGQPKHQEKHEFEIIIGHANVIRYFMCRALQLPPEAWLRLCIFNCSLTYLTIRPTGTVSCRMLGDIGHLGYDHSTFSMHHGFNW